MSDGSADGLQTHGTPTVNVSAVIGKQSLLSYPWSSLPEFLTEKSDLIFRDPVLEHFQTAEHYKKFVFDNIDYGRELEGIKHLVLE